MAARRRQYNARRQLRRASSAARAPASRGFAPIVAPGARILILGSLPGRASLEAQQYYAQLRNAFWPIMGQLFDAGPAVSYRLRTRTLTRQGIAVWDVLAAAVRAGSLDSSIERSTERPNRFAELFEAHPTIERVCFNGATAARLFLRHVATDPYIASLPLTYHTLPSTSPAHAAMSFPQKLARWRTVLRT